MIITPLFLDMICLLWPRMLMYSTSHWIRDTTKQFQLCIHMMYVDYQNKQVLICNTNKDTIQRHSPQWSWYDILYDTIPQTAFVITSGTRIVIKPTLSLSSDQASKFNQATNVSGFSYFTEIWIAIKKCILECIINFFGNDFKSIVI